MAGFGSIRTRGPRGGGSISVSGRQGEPAISVHAHIEGVERTSKEFRDARRQFNAAMRLVIQQAGEKTVLPAIKQRFPRLTGRFGDSLFIKRDRTTVYIGSRMRGAENRALGWIDFGGKHPRHRRRRKGPYVIVNELAKRRTEIDAAILVGLMETFNPLEHRP